jgi:hypothetical protein
MRYLCLVYLDPTALEVLPRDELTKLMSDSVEADETLRRAGQLVAAGPLKPVNTAMTVRSRGGKVVMTDGPYAESKEVLAGFVYVEVESREEALRIAASLPVAKYGSIEVREMQRVVDPRPYFN